MIVIRPSAVVSNIFNILSSGDIEIARIVIGESTAEWEEARKFMEDVRVTFPQVCGYEVGIGKISYKICFCHLNQLLWSLQPPEQNFDNSFFQLSVFFCKTRECALSNLK